MEKETPPSEAMGLVNLASPRMGTEIYSVSDDFLLKPLECYKIQYQCLYPTNLMITESGWMAGSLVDDVKEAMTGA